MGSLEQNFYNTKKTQDPIIINPDPIGFGSYPKWDKKKMLRYYNTVQREARFC
jgi:hypothetical protein